MNFTMGLAALGLTKQSAISAGIAMLTRRVAVSQFNEADQFMSLSHEVKLFLHDSKYRKDMKKIGKGLRDTAFGKTDLLPRLAIALRENSTTMEHLADQFEYGEGENFVVDDELVDTVSGEIVGLLRTYAGPVLGISLEDENPTTLELSEDTEFGPETVFFGEALKVILNGTPDEVLFPDIVENLSRKV